jgi:IclR family transcriptional regulator, KDG regulon repressor
MHELLERLAQLRRVGWCEAIDEAIPGVHSVAVAVESAAAQETLAFCLSFPDSHISEIALRRTVRMLTAAARRIAEKVGDRFWESLPRELAA